MNLDQYYTKPKVAEWCLQELALSLPETAGKHFIEPSAGSGSFFTLLPKRHRTGLDIAPQGEGIKEENFLRWVPRSLESERYVVIGNPPFGHRSRLAIQFFNHSATMADVIAFIVPKQFQKYSVHSKLHKDFKLIRDLDLAEDSFYTPEGKDFSVRSVFQIWTREERGHEDLRIHTPPPTSHPDFTMHQYNNTKEALKVFDYEWDFAVPRQGYEDYKRRETEAERCEKNKQWILFKPYKREVYERLWNLDFFTLAKKNTAVYGFGKADVVMAYKKLFNA